MVRSSPASRIRGNDFKPQTPDEAREVVELRFAVGVQETVLDRLDGVAANAFLWRVTELLEKADFEV